MNEYVGARDGIGYIDKQLYGSVSSKYCTLIVNNSSGSIFKIILLSINNLVVNFFFFAKSIGKCLQIHSFFFLVVVGGVDRRSVINVLLSMCMLIFLFCIYFVALYLVAQFIHSSNKKNRRLMSICV